jgi:uncharacterized protein (TIGR00369 family)
MTTRAASVAAADDAADERAADPPEGFVPVRIGGEFATRNGPLFARWHDDRLQLGFRVAPRHVNPGQNCHGGMLGMLADIVLSSSAHYQTDMPRQFLPTISLQTDFVASAPLGSWVHAQADILRMTRRLLFSQGLVWADGQLVMRISGVFKRGPLLPDSGSDHELSLPGMPARQRQPP